MALGFRVSFIGLPALRAEMSRAAVRLQPVMREQVEKAATLVENASIKNIAGSRTRSLFMVKGGKRVRRKTPLPITARPDQTGIFGGRLRQSASHRVSPPGKSVEAEVGFSAIYAKRQENMRSFLGRAVKETQERVFALIGQTFKVLP